MCQQEWPCGFHDEHVRTAELRPRRLTRETSFAAARLGLRHTRLTARVWFRRDVRRHETETLECRHMTDLARLETDNWELESAVQRHLSAPSTFRIPPEYERRGLRVGQAAKLIFKIRVFDDAGNA